MCSPSIAQGAALDLLLHTTTSQTLAAGGPAAVTRFELTIGRPVVVLCWNWRETPLPWVAAYGKLRPLKDMPVAAAKFWLFESRASASSATPA